MNACMHVCTYVVHGSSVKNNLLDEGLFKRLMGEEVLC